MAAKKTTTKQKQKQSQSVKVIVNLPEKKQRRKRTRKPKQREAEVVDFKAFPPQIIYPSAPLTFYQSPQEAPKSILSPPVPPRSFLEDIGQVGTEGRVEILELPTKVETLQDLESPVPVRTPRVPISLAEMEKRKKRPEPLPFQEPQFPFSLEEFERTTKKNEDIPIRKPREPVSLAEITMKTKMPVSFTEIPVEEEPFGMSPEQVAQSEFFSEKIPPLEFKETKIRKTKKQLAEEKARDRADMEIEYEMMTGSRPPPSLTDKELRNELKKVRTQVLPSLASPYVAKKGKIPQKADVELNRQQLITDFYKSASDKNVSKDDIDQIIDVDTISGQQLTKLTRTFKNKKTKFQTIIRTLENLPVAVPL